jgi:hypothetical protein
MHTPNSHQQGKQFHHVEVFGEINKQQMITSDDFSYSSADLSWP